MKAAQGAKSKTERRHECTAGEKVIMPKRATITLQISILVIGFCISSAAGQEPARTRNDLLKELVTLMAVRENAPRMFEAVTTRMKDQYPKMTESILSSEPDLTPEQRQKIMTRVGEDSARFIKSFQEKVSQQLDFGQIVEEVSY